MLKLLVAPAVNRKLREDERSTLLSVPRSDEFAEVGIVFEDAELQVS